MKITVLQQNRHVTLSLEGRLDTGTALQTSHDIDQQLAACGDIDSLTCDFEHLEYISSSGLRIMLGLAKKYPNFRIIEAQPDVYRLLDITGFSKIMPVERALRRISIEGCDVVGRGGIGTVYRIDDDTIVKTFTEGKTLEEVRSEIDMSKEVFVLGMPTAISFDIVRVGKQLGLVFELLHADTVSACIQSSPDRIDELAYKFADLLKQMHSIHVPTESTIPSAITLEEKAIRRISRYFDSESTDLLLQILNHIPPADRLLHGDLQTKNVMLQGDELMLIDMGEVGYGHPMHDLGHTYSSMCSLIGSYEQIINLPESVAKDFFMRMINYYFEGEPKDVINHRLEQIRTISRIRNFAWLSLSDFFPPEVIDMCKSCFSERVTQQKDELLRVCKTFNDWTLD